MAQDEQKIDDLRRHCKHLMIDLELDQRGMLSVLAGDIGTNPQSLSMALSGYRNGHGSLKILTRLKEDLEKRTAAAE